MKERKKIKGILVVVLAIVMLLSILQLTPLDFGKSDKVEYVAEAASGFDGTYIPSADTEGKVYRYRYEIPATGHEYLKKSICSGPDAASKYDYYNYIYSLVLSNDDGKKMFIPFNSDSEPNSRKYMTDAYNYEFYKPTSSYVYTSENKVSESGSTRTEYYYNWKHESIVVYSNIKYSSYGIAGQEYGFKNGDRPDSYRYFTKFTSVPIVAKDISAFLKINGKLSEGGTMNNPAEFITSNASISWESSSSYITVQEQGKEEVIYNNGGTSLTLSANYGERKVFLIKTENATREFKFYYRIIVDKRPPNLKVNVNNKVQWTGANQNSNEVVAIVAPGDILKFYATDDNSITERSVNNATYVDGASITAQIGTYIFKAVDSLGNISYAKVKCEDLPSKLVIGGTEYPGGTISNPQKLLFGKDTVLTFDLSTRKRIVITNPDGTIATLTNVGINNHTIRAVANSVVTYKICSENPSGNSKIYYEITLKTTAPSFNKDKLAQWYKKSHWWNTNGTSFGTLALAQKEAVDKEYKDFVIEYTLNNVRDFTETHLLAEGETVAVGKYYKYKAAGNDTAFVYYFSRSNLQQVIENYASKNIVEKFLKKGSTTGYEKLDQSMFASTVTIDNKTAYFVNGYTFKKGYPSDKLEYNSSGTWLEIPTNAPFDGFVSTTGVYEVRESDELGNATLFSVYVDKTAPKAEYTAQRDDVVGDIKNIISVADIPLGSALQYFFKEFKFNIIDNDDLAIIQVINTIGNKKFANVNDVVLARGENEILIYDRSGNGFEFTIVIQGRTPNVQFGGTSSKMTVSIEKVEKYNTIENIEIYKNGIKLTLDDKNERITKSTLNYEFTKGGSFEVRVKDNFGRTTSFKNTFEKDLPMAEFIGVTPPGSTNKNVQINYEYLKYNISITKNGEKFVVVEKTNNNIASIVIEATAQNSGKYVVYVTEKDDPNVGRTYEFSINKTNPIATLVGVDNNGTTSKDVYITWSDDSYTATYTKDKTNMGAYSKGAILSAEGYYVVTVKDVSGNETVFAFAIQKSMSFRIIVGGYQVLFLDETNRDVQFMTDKPETTKITIATASGKYIAYKWGDVISNEGEYIYRVHDALGNSSSSTFKIDKTKPVGTLKGVDHKGKTNGVVSFNWNEGNATAALFNNKQLVGQYIRNNLIDTEGSYKIKLSDKAGNFTEYEFQIDRSVEFTVNVQNGLISNVPVTISSDEKELTIDLMKDGELMKYKFNSAIKENGHYSFKILDKFNNYNEYSFIVLTTPINSFSYEPPTEYSWNEIWREGDSVDTAAITKYDYAEDGTYTCSLTKKESGQTFNFNVTIDTVPPVVTLIGVENGGSTDSSVTVVSDEAEIKLEVTRNDNAYKTAIGKAIKSDGEYVIKAYDQAGNETRLAFVINYAINGAGIGAIGIGGTGLGALIITILKKKKPQ